MSRGDGFQVADVDSSYMDDAKLRALWQRLRDPDQMARAVVLHQSTVLASWRHGDRVTVSEAAPVWLECGADLIAALVSVHLLDRTGRVPVSSWKEWFGPADDRRAKRRAAGATGGRASGNVRRSNAEATVEQASTVAEPDRTVPTVPSVEEPHTPPSGVPRVNPRANGTNPRARGTNPRAIAELQDAARKREARVAANLLVAHNHGAHADDADPRCGYCRERSAAYA